jgi:hypothetical protein
MPDFALAAEPSPLPFSRLGAYFIAHDETTAKPATSLLRPLYRRTMGH